jgi:hypothetical protein
MVSSHPNERWRMSVRLAEKLSVRCDPEFWAAHADFAQYVRRSDPTKPNGSIAMQMENVPLEVQKQFGLAPNSPNVFYYTEEVTGADADVFLQFTADEGTKIVGMKRDEFEDMLRQAEARWEASGRTRVQIICGFTLNRIGRSDTAVYMLRRMAKKMYGMLLVWTADNPGTFIRPHKRDGALQLWAVIDLAGGSELDTKSVFVGGTKIMHAKNSPDRSLSERAVGYERFPVDASGTEITDLTAKIDHYRLRICTSEVPIVEGAFSLCLDGVRPRRIAQRLQSKYGNHPKTGRPWSERAVRWMLRNSLYIGTRRYGRRGAFEPGSKRRLARPEAEQTESPYTAALHIIPTETFHAVQRRLSAWAGDKKGSMGRPRGRELYFDRNKLLRCALCEGCLTINKYGEKYSYRCNHLAERGFPQCQSHPVGKMVGETVIEEGVDPAITRMLQQAFEHLADYRRQLEREVASNRGRSNREREALEEQLRQARMALEESKGRILALAMTASPATIQLLDADIQAKAKEIESLQHRIETFGQSEADKQKQEMLYLLNGMESFTASDFTRRRALLKKLVATVWIWPDARVWIHWKGVSEEESRAQCLKELGRVIGEAKAWESIDFARMEEETKRLIEGGEIPQEAFLDIVSNATTYSWLVKGRPINPSTLLKLFKRAKDEYVDMARLRREVLAWMQERAEEGATVYRLAQDTGLARRTVEKMLEGGPLRRDSFIKAAHVIGGAEQFRLLPQGLHDPASVDAVLYWQGMGDDSLADDVSGSSGT